MNVYGLIPLRLTSPLDRIGGWLQPVVMLTQSVVSYIESIRYCVFFLLITLRTPLSSQGIKG